MNDKHYLFARNLVKGKIAETIFSQMLREVQKFTVLEFGYEKVIPDLINRGLNKRNTDEIIETLRTAPDFAVIDNEKKTVHLIEVKYRRRLDDNEVLECAKRMHQSWNPSYLFIASLEGFFLDEINTIIKNNGQINSLTHENIPLDIQHKYLQILRDFEGNN